MKSKRRATAPRRTAGAPFLHRIASLPEKIDPAKYPFYILDEPEAALSPQRHLTFLKIIHDLSSAGHAQFIIATHSPIILSYPGAVLFSLDGDALQEIDYRETKHFLITRDFLNSPERFFKHLFGTPEDTESESEQ